MPERPASASAALRPPAKLGNLKLGAGLIARRNEASGTTPKSILWYFGAAYPVTPNFTVDGEAFKLDYKNSANGATLLALRGTCALSKRTAVYATAGHIGNDGPLAGRSQTGLAAGVRHSF